MQSTPDFNSSAAAKSLLRRSRQGALATLIPESGAPYCSLVNVATYSDGAPLLLLSRLALHTKNILADSRVSLMLDERRADDPLQGARIMLGGQADAAATPATGAIWRRRYLAAHPEAEVFVGFTDFAFYRIDLHSIHLVAGFGRIIDLNPKAVLTDLTDADTLLEAEPDIIAHLNADHRDTLRLYVTGLLHGPGADWSCSGCDPEGLDLQAEGQPACRLPFPEPVTTPVALRYMLKQMADRIRAATE
jgi:putative heme iron utilization protein